MRASGRRDIENKSNKRATSRGDSVRVAILTASAPWSSARWITSRSLAAAGVFTKSWNEASTGTPASAARATTGRMNANERTSISTIDAAGRREDSASRRDAGDIAFLPPSSGWRAVRIQGKSAFGIFSPRQSTRHSRKSTFPLASRNALRSAACESTIPTTPPTLSVETMALRFDTASVFLARSPWPRGLVDIFPSCLLIATKSICNS